MTKSSHLMLSAAVAAVLVAGPAMAAGVRVTSTVLVQEKKVAADGTTQISLVAPKRVLPGDRVVYRISYRNEVGQPVSGMVVSNAVPAGLAYRGPAEGSPAPEVSVDGKTFASLTQLRARAEDVKVVRWPVAGAIPVGGSGQYAFEATLK